MAKIQDISIQNPIYHWIKVDNGSVSLTEIVTNKIYTSNEIASKVITIKFEDINPLDKKKRGRKVEITNNLPTKVVEFSLSIYDYSHNKLYVDL